MGSVFLAKYYTVSVLRWRETCSIIRQKLKKGKGVKNRKTKMKDKYANIKGGRELENTEYEKVKV